MILPTIQHFQMLGYWVVSFTALLETTIGIDLILPGSTLILFLGALSGRGYFDFGDLLWFAVLGAVLGDQLFLGEEIWCPVDQEWGATSLFPQGVCNFTSRSLNLGNYA